MRVRFGHVFLGILKTQLVLKGVIAEDDWQNMKNHILVDFARDNYFTELKDSELLRERIQTLDMISGYVGEYFSKEAADDEPFDKANPNAGDEDNDEKLKGDE